MQFLKQMSWVFVCTTLENEIYSSPWDWAKCLRLSDIVPKISKLESSQIQKKFFGYLLIYFGKSVRKLVFAILKSEVCKLQWNPAEGESIMSFENPSLKCFENWKSTVFCNDIYEEKYKISFTILARQVLQPRKKFHIYLSYISFKLPLTSNICQRHVQLKRPKWNLLGPDLWNQSDSVYSLCRN